MLYRMGVSLRVVVPNTPHMTALADQVPSWNPQLRALLRQELHRGLVGDDQPRSCAQNIPVGGLYFSPEAGPLNARLVPGKEKWNAASPKRAFESGTSKIGQPLG